MAISDLNDLGASGPGVLGSTHGISKQKKSIVKDGLSKVLWLPKGITEENLSDIDNLVYKRFLRWQRLRVVQYLFGDAKNFEAFKRTASCFRIRYQKEVSVLYSKKVSRAHFVGVVVCGSPWTCPVCSAKISSRRAVELASANDKGLSKILVTYTFQHDNKDSLKDLIKVLNEGLKDLKNQRQYKSLLAEIGFVGAVTSTELTISNKNGWHVHKHTLMYSSLPYDKLSFKRIKNVLARTFSFVLGKRKRYASWANGVHVAIGDSIKEEYLAKFGKVSDDLPDEPRAWSLENEITKGNFKSSKKEDHFHPFDLLDMYFAGNRLAGRKFIEYATYMKGQKQLVYTKGLRNLLGLNVEASDIEIATAEQEDSVLFSTLDADDWYLVLKKEKRGNVLEVASQNNRKVFAVYMRSLGSKNQKWLEV